MKKLLKTTATYAIGLSCFFALEATDTVFVDRSANLEEAIQLTCAPEEVTYLDLGYKRLHDINGLESMFPNLTSLDLTCNLLSDISGSGTFPNLTSLTLTSNLLSDVSRFGEMFPNLTSLELSANPLASLNGLQDLKKLEWLGLWGPSNVISTQDIIDLSIAIPNCTISIYGGRVKNGVYEQSPGRPKRSGYRPWW